ncbi:potassium channel family protein [Streptomyces sp. 900105755]
MRALIAGAGRLGPQIAQVLAAARNDVTLVDVDEDRVAELDGHLPVRLLAGALTADLVVAATGEDEDNLVISLLATRQFTVPRVAARVNDAENTWLFDQSWGVDTAVPAATPLISLIEEATGATDTVALLRLSKAGVDVIETAITPESSAVGRTLAGIRLPTGAVIATVIRDGRPTVPAPEMRLQPGDELLIVSHAATEQEIHAAFQ